MEGTEWLKSFPEGLKGAQPSPTVQRTMQKLAEEFNQEQSQWTDDRVKLAREHVSIGRLRHDPERGEVPSAKVLTDSEDQRIQELKKQIGG